MTMNELTDPKEGKFASPASALIGDPARFGRVDENGTVFVITSAGEKMVGSYPGKTAEEALAYFVRKFEVVASEVALLAARIISGAMVPEDGAAAVRKLRNQIEHLNGVGDLEASEILLSRFRRSSMNIAPPTKLAGLPKRNRKLLNALQHSKAKSK